MFARSVSFIVPAAVCFLSLAELNAQSKLGWPAVKTAPPDMIAVMDTRPRPAGPAPTMDISRSDRKRLEPDAADKTRFRELLKEDGFGLVKLLNVDCDADGPLVVHIGDCGDSIPGHGADFSFRAGRHVFAGIADLKLNGGTLVVGSVMTQGLLVSIGNVDVRTVDLSSNAVKFLTAFAPAPDIHGAEQQTLLLTKGFWNNGIFCRATATAAEGQTYLLRTIAYRLRNDGGDKREDLVVIFTIVRQDPAGNVTLIWRRLQNKVSPKIILEE